MADQSLIQSGKALYDQQATQADLGGAFKEGKKMVTDQIDKNIEMEKEDQRWKHEKEKMDYQEFLWEQDVDDKLTAAQVEKEEYFKLIEDGIHSGKISGPGYDNFIKDREMWWKNNANRYKAMADIGDKKIFAKKLEIAVLAENNWGKLVQGAGQISISDAAPDAQRKNLAISGWGQANPNTPPPISSKNGVDFFVIPNADINGDGKIDQSDVEGDYDEGQVTMIPVKDVAGAQTGTEVYGTDVREKATVAGLQHNILNTELFKDLRAGYGNVNDIGLWFDANVPDDIAVQEVAQNLFQNTGIDPVDVGVTDVNGDGKIDFKDLPKSNGSYDKGAIREIFKQAVLKMDGVKETQDPNKRPLSLEQQKTIAEIQYKKSQTHKNYQTGKETESGPSNNQKAFDNYTSSNDVSELEGIGDIAQVKKKANGTWVVTLKNGKEVEAGDGNLPDTSTLRNHAGVDADYTGEQEGPRNLAEDVDSYITNFSNIPYTN